MSSPQSFGSDLLTWLPSMFQIILHSMHKYQPRVHVIRKDFSSELSPNKPVPSGEGVKTFSFPETVFTTVTAYQNQQVREWSQGRVGTDPRTPIIEYEIKAELNTINVFIPNDEIHIVEIWLYNTSYYYGIFSQQLSLITLTNVFYMHVCRSPD